MRLFEAYQLEEASAPLKVLPNDIALMTKNEFLEFQNPRGKMHPPTAYDWSVEDMNEKIGSTKSTMSYGKALVIEKEKGYLVKYNSLYHSMSTDKPFAVIHNGTAYYTENKNLIPRGFIDRQRGLDVDYGIQRYKRVKYLSEYIEMIDPTEPNTTKYPNLINRKKIGDENFELRSGDEYGISLAILNDGGQVVAVAQDEWGASLIAVAQEYRGYGLDQWVSEKWYEMNPDMTSGGYTPAGQQHDLRRWSNRVRKFLANGWYRELIDQGKITKEKVKQIVSEIKPKKEYKKPKKESEGNLLIYVNYPSFVLYDDRFLDNPSPDYIRAHGFIRSYDNKPFVYKLDYERMYKKLAHAIILQLQKTYDENYVDITVEPSDVLEVEGIDGVASKDGKVYLEKDLLDLERMRVIEKKVREAKSDYPNELSDALLEDADRKKWDI